MLLALPDVRQDRDDACGTAAVEVVRRFFGLKARAPDLSNPVQGTAPDTVAAVLRSLDLRVLAGQMIGGVADLQHFTKLGCPVVCPITARAGGHWVVVAGVARKKVYFQDPETGPGALAIADWLDGWRDTSAETLQAFDRWGVVVGA
jgi:predicted double-glycine peptidase